MFHARDWFDVRAILASAALVALLVTGCSDGDARTAVVRPVDASGAITVVAQNTSYNVQRIEVEAGATTTIALANRDTITHTFTIYAGNSPDGAIAADTGEVAAGESGEAVVLFAVPGLYAFRCEVHPDRMRGIVVVR